MRRAVGHGRSPTGGNMRCSCGDDGDGMDLERGQYITCKAAKYIVVDKIGHGGYGAVYKVTREPPCPTEREYAMKVERKVERREHSKLNMEVHLLKLMQSKSSGKSHFVKMFDKAKKDRFFMIVMTLVGDSLDELKRRRKPPIFSLGTGLGAGIQCLEAIEQLHNVGFIHRDIKPGNFAIGRFPRTHFIYILDFGIARRFVNQENDVKAPREKVRFKGTVRFASLRCHRGGELGRKDDVESWLYMLVDMCHDEGLPWQREKDKKVVHRMKIDARTYQGKIRLFEPLGLSYMETIMIYLDDLSYADVIDYNYIYKILGKAASTMRLELNDLFDWEKQRTFNDDGKIPPSPAVFMHSAPSQ